MRNRIALLVVFAAFTFWAVTGLAQKPQQAQNVQITKGPTIESVTGNSAVIAWSTNVNASTVLKYGTDRNNLNQTAEAPWGGLTHRVTLHNLQPNTTYYFDVESGQGQGTGTGAISGVSQFKTQSGPGAASNQPPAPPAGSPGSMPGFNAATFSVVAGPIPQQITDRSAKLWWETNQPISGSTVKYGSSPGALKQTAQSTSSSDNLSHTADLANLQPDTMVYFSIVRPDGKVAHTGNFKTESANFAKDRTVDITNGPVIEYLADNQAIIAWTTSAPSSSVVKYGTSQNALNQTAEAPWTSGTHRVTINNLQPNTKYYFQVQSAQAQGTGTAVGSGVYPFQTVATGQSAMRISLQH